MLQTKDPRGTGRKLKISNTSLLNAYFRMLKRHPINHFLPNFRHDKKCIIPHPNPLLKNMSDDQKQQQIDEISERLARMEKFVTRRFDEISAEIHATCQMLDMAETGIGQKFSEILRVLSAITFSGSGSSPHNVGVELDAVVKTTEDAANRILDSATAISEMMKEDSAHNWSDQNTREKFFKHIQNHTDNILTACAFQDLTGQRIGKTLENIRKAEAELSEMLAKMGIQMSFDPVHPDISELPKDVQNDNLSTQDDVDALFR